MKEDDFKIFSRLIQDVWFKSFPEMELKEPIVSYENKLLQIADKIEELTIDKVQKEGYPITTRSLRSYTDAVLKDKYNGINPSSRIKEILSRYVLSIPKLTGKDLLQWDEKKEYKLEKYWKQYQQENFATAFINIPESTKENLLQEDEKNENNLEKYHEESLQESSSVLIKNKLTRRTIFSVVLIFFALISVCYFAFQNVSKDDIGINFTTSFKNIYTPGELFNTGWKVLDPDTNYIHEGLKNANGKGLQLYTLLGDYWVTDTMRRFIKNTFVLAIPQGDFKAEVSLSMSDYSDFKCSHQQAGIILLNDTTNLANNIRFTVIKDSPNTSLRLSEVYSKAKPEKNKWEQNLNEISQKEFPNSSDSAKDVRLKKLYEVSLQIVKYHGYFIFRFKAGGNDRPFFPAFVSQFNFEPKFICLAAFQGQVNDREKLTVCDTIPIIFSDFHISANDKDDKILLDALLKKS